MPEERGPVKRCFRWGLRRVDSTAVLPSWDWLGCLTVAIAGTVLPLVRCAARWGVLGHAFAIAPGSARGVAWCCSA
jgi:hypothetical protein